MSDLTLLREAFFLAIEAFAQEQKLTFVGVGKRLGIPAWQMSRWFPTGDNEKSYTGFTNPKPHILEAVVQSKAEPVATIALNLLRELHGVRAKFDFDRAAAEFGFNVGMPVALASALLGHAGLKDLTRAAAFDLVSCFATAQYLTDLSAASIEGYRTVPIHSFGMVDFADPDDKTWPSTIGWPLLDWNFSDENMQRQLSIVDELLEAGAVKSNMLFNLLDKALKLRSRANTTCADVHLAAIAANDALHLSNTVHEMTHVFRESAEHDATLSKSPLHRLASRLYELSSHTRRYTEAIAERVLSRAEDALGEDHLDKLLHEPKSKMVPFVELSGGAIKATSIHSRTYTSVLPKMTLSCSETGDAYFLSSSYTLEPEHVVKSSDCWKPQWK